jgi:hypothetical protein
MMMVFHLKALLILIIMKVVQTPVLKNLHPHPHLHPHLLLNHQHQVIL